MSLVRCFTRLKPEIVLRATAQQVYVKNMPDNSLAMEVNGFTISLWMLLDLLE